MTIYITVYVDEHASDQLNSLGRYYLETAVQNLCTELGWGWASAWEKTGLPVRFYLQHDALNEKIPTPRLAIFLCPLTMTSAEYDAIMQRFGRDNRVIVMVGAPGLAAPGTAYNPAKFTGLSLAESNKTTNRPLVFVDSQDPLLEGIQPGTILGVWHDSQQMAWYDNLCLNGPVCDGDTVLANYAESSLPGLIASRRDGYTLVWSGIPGGLNQKLIRNLARAAGLSPWVPEDNSLYYGAGLLGVAGTPAGGPSQVILPQGISIEKCLTGHEFTQDGNLVKFTLQSADYYPDIIIFSVTAEK